jgi:ADP-dependent NAD(P)H-hydrate dehydratase
MADPSPPILVSSERLRDMPLPPAGGGKEERGRVLLIGGGRQVPGPLRLSGEAVLRAGAGKLQIGTAASLAAEVGLHLPECRVFALPETGEGEIASAAAEDLLPRARQCDTVLIGPGMVDVEAAGELTLRLLTELDPTAFILDAGALMALWDCGEALKRHGGKVVITPHAGEMAGMCGQDADEIEADPPAAARRAAERLGVVVALKGRVTFIAGPDGELLEHHHASDGLGTAGSGDVLAGLMAGFLARGADALTAAVWGVAVHARCGERLGPPGYLARDLPAQAPAVIADLG